MLQVLSIILAVMCYDLYFIISRLEQNRHPLLLLGLVDGTITVKRRTCYYILGKKLTIYIALKQHIHFTKARLSSSSAVIIHSEKTTLFNTS